MTVSAGQSSKENSTTLGLSVAQDLLPFIESSHTNPDEWKAFCEKMKIPLLPQDTTGPDWIQSLSARIYLANIQAFVDDHKTQQYFASLGIDVQGGKVIIREGSTLYDSVSFRASLGMDTNSGVGSVVSGKYERQLDAKTTATALVSMDYISAI